MEVEKGVVEGISIRWRRGSGHKVYTGCTYLPAGISSAEVREVVENPAVDVTECDALIW